LSWPNLFSHLAAVNQNGKCPPYPRVDVFFSFSETRACSYKTLPPRARYDQAKLTAQKVLGESDSLGARTLAALVGGVITSLVGCPFDVLKTRLMNQGAAGGAVYTGGISIYLYIYIYIYI